MYPFQVSAWLAIGYFYAFFRHKVNNSIKRNKSKKEFGIEYLLVLISS